MDAKGRGGRQSCHARTYTFVHYLERNVWQGLPFCKPLWLTILVLSNAGCAFKHHLIPVGEISHSFCSSGWGGGRSGGGGSSRCEGCLFVCCGEPFDAWVWWRRMINMSRIQNCNRALTVVNTILNIVGGFALYVCLFV